MTGGGTRGEIAMRIEGAGAPGRRAEIEGVLRGLDPEAALRVDEATGIAHVVTSAEALEVDAALTKAGFDVTGVTG